MDGNVKNCDTTYISNDLIIVDNEDGKVIHYDGFNCIFDKKTGETLTYGNTKDDDPSYCKYGPIIVDLELSTICSGPMGKLCSFCYKSNNPFGSNMSYDTFVSIFEKLPKTVTQIAFGVDATCTSNPDTIKIMKYCKDNGVIPNVTVAQLYDDTADELSKVCGAVAVSRYEDKNICYDTVKMLTDRGMNQAINIHIMISEETFDMVKETIKDILTGDERLKKLNAIVFLSLKKKGRGINFTPLTDKHFTEIVDTCLHYGIRFGFDSCSAVKFINSIKGYPNEKEMIQMSEPCESAKFSAYINVNGDFFPCSFVEGEGEWVEGLNVQYCQDFISDIWNNPKTINFRNMCNMCIGRGIACQMFEI